MIYCAGAYTVDTRSMETKTTGTHLTNPHDQGWDIVTGNGGGPGDYVGRLGWDGHGDEAGLVINWADGVSAMLYDAADAAKILRAHGYELDADSIDDIERLVTEQETERAA